MTMPARRIALPVACLLDRWLRAQGMTRRDLVHALPFADAAKTERRLRELEEGRHLLDLLAALAVVLRIAPGELDEAVRQTREAAAAQQRRAADERFRATFRPHAVWAVAWEEARSSNEGLALVREALRRLFFPPNLPPSERPAYPQERCPTRIDGFGGVFGFAVNHDPDRATLHRRDGTHVATLPHASMLPAPVKLSGYCGTWMTDRSRAE